jgi:hypothetical protein
VPHLSRRATGGVFDFGSRSWNQLDDVNSHAAFFTYDAFGPVTHTNFQSSLSENHQYEADNNLTSVRLPVKSSRDTF